MNYHIGCDLDGVLYPWHELVFLYCQQIPKYHAEVFTPFWQTKIPSLSKEEQDFIVNLPLYDILPPNSDMLKVLNMLVELGNTISYITSRPKIYKHVTDLWAKRFEIPFENRIFFLQDEETKSDVINKLRIDFYFEDKTAEIINIDHNTDTNVIRLYRPWTEGNNFPESVQSFGRHQSKDIIYYILTKGMQNG